MATLGAADNSIGPQPMDIRAEDLALISADRQLFSQFLEPFAHSLEGQPARRVYEIADELAAYYIAATLAYLARILPPPEKKSWLFSGRRSHNGQMFAADPAVMQANPKQALSQWVETYQHTGGALLMEARAIFQQITVVEVLRGLGLPVPPDCLALFRFPEELPDEEYLQTLLLTLVPESVRWPNDRFAERTSELRIAFEESFINFGIRVLRMTKNEHAAQVNHLYVTEGFAVADTMLRMHLPNAVYRKRRLEALAIFQELIVPIVASRPFD